MKLILIIFAALYFVACSCSPNYSEGERIGVVTKISRKGLLFKSWEASALIALPASVGSNVEPERFDFNVDESAVQMVQEAAANGKRVKLIYHQWAISPIDIENDHVVTKVEAVTP